MNHRRNSAISAAAAALALAAALLLPIGAAAETVVAGKGSGSGQVLRPAGLAVDQASARLYVGDSENQRVDVFDAEDGQFLEAYGWGVSDGSTAAFQHCSTTCLVGVGGSGKGQFTRPGPVAVDNDPSSSSHHDVYVVDSGNFRVEKFDPDGNFLLTFGDGVDKTTGGDICTASSGDLCGAGTPGGAPGQLNDIGGIAVGAGGVVYVADQVGEGSTAESRVQRFSSAGAFMEELLLPVAGGAGTTTAFALDSGQDLILATNGERGAVRKYSPAGALLWTRDPSFNIGALAVDASDDVFVGENTVDTTFILEFDPGGTQTRTLYGELRGGSNVAAIAPYPAADGALFVAENYTLSSDFRLLRVDQPPPGPLVYPDPASTYAAPIGNVKATLHAQVNPEGMETTDHFQYVDQAGFEDGGWSGPDVVSTPESPAFGPDFELHPASQPITGLTPETVYHFRLVATNADAPAGNPGPEETFKTQPQVPFGPLWSTAVGASSAVLHAEINPLGFAASGTFEYVDQKSFESSGFADAQRVPAAPIDFGAGEALVEGNASIDGLVPATGYRYRLTVEEHCDPSEPTVLCTFHSEVSSFHTLAMIAAPPTACRNAVFRTAAAAFLPDCRAYEMVSPLDKHGANVEVVFDSTGYPAGLDQAAREGGRIAYSAYRSFARPKGAPYTSQYLAERTAEGWRNASISPPREGSTLYNFEQLEYQFKAFTADLCSGWPLQDTAKPLLAPGALAGYPDLYRRGNCPPGPGTYEALTTVVPPADFRPDSFFPELQGFSADGTRSFFSTTAALEPSAPTGRAHVYEAHGGTIAPVCVLPDETVSPDDCTLGTGNPNQAERNDNVAGAVSTDGSVVYWTDALQTPGPLYVRIGGSETVLVSGQDAQFWDAAADGSKAIYTVGESLFVFDLASRSSTLLAEGVKGVAGASEDATRLYFGSTSALAAGATAGQLNLYGYLDGAVRFIGALAAGDAPGNRPSSISERPYLRTSRVTPDGNRLVFMSKANLTGYDNLDSANGEPDLEVYLYDATQAGGAGRLRCISCNPTESRPSGHRWSPIEGKYSFDQNWTAGWIPGWENQLYAPRVISGDGTRVLFNSFDRLVARDTDGTQDVYEWEAPGAGDCEEADASYVPASGGCISLISSGESSRPSELTDISSAGEEVFFKTYSSLDPADPGLIDIYDARIDGGFPPPPAPAGECEGEGCLAAPAPAAEPPVPQSSTFIAPPRRRHRCRKAKGHRKARCSKKHTHHRKHHKHHKHHKHREGGGAGK